MDLAIRDGLGRHHQLNGGGGAEEVADHGLGGVHREGARVIPEQPLDGGGLDGVVVGGAGAVRVDVLNVGRVDLAVAQRVPHGPRRAETVLLGSGDVEGVVGGPVALHLGVDPSSALLGVFVLLEDEEAGPFAHHKPIPIQIKGARCFVGRIVAGGERLGGGEPRHGERGDGGLGAARHHEVALVPLDGAPGHADRVSSRGAGARGGERRPHEPVSDRNLTADGVGHDPRDEVRRDAPRAAVPHHVVLLEDTRDAPDARAHDGPEALTRRFGQIAHVTEARVSQGLVGCHQGPHREGVQLPLVLHVEPAFIGGPLHLRGNGRGDPRGVETIQGGDAVLAR